MHQSTTPSLSQTIWPIWAPRQFPSLPIVQTFLPVIFGYSLSSEAVVMRQLMRQLKEAVTKINDTLTQDVFHGAFQKLLVRYKCIAAGGDYFEEDKSFMCVLSIKVPIRKSLETYRMLLIYILQHISQYNHNFDFNSGNILIYIQNKRIRRIFEAAAFSFFNYQNTRAGFYNISPYLSKSILNSYNIFHLLLIYSPYIIILCFLFFFLSFFFFLLIRNLSR